MGRAALAIDTRTCDSMCDAAGRHAAESHDAQVFSSHQRDMNPAADVVGWGRGVVES
jgi:hypothetical protein